MHELRAETPLETSQRQQNRQSSKNKHFIESITLHNAENQQIHNVMLNMSIELVKSGSTWVKSNGTSLSCQENNIQYFQSHMCEVSKKMNSQICTVLTIG